MNYKDYYKTLGVSKNASEDEVKGAYRKLAKEFHPDRNQDNPTAEAKFKEINEAYEVIGDAEKRKLYDQFGADAANGRVPPGGGGYTYQGGGNAGDFSDFFQTLFGGGFGGAAPGGGARGAGGFGGGRAGRVNVEDMFGGGGFGGNSGGYTRAAPDVEGTLPVALTEAFRGTTRTVSVGGKSIDVNIPKGTRDGQKLRLKGQAPGGANVMLTLKVQSDPTFKLEGDDVRVVLDVPAAIAVVGGKVQALTLEGRGEVSIPPRSQAGRVLRLRGQGWHKKDGSRGDLLLEMRLVVPKEPTEAELELWQRLAESTLG